MQRNYVPATPPLSERIRNAWRILWRVAAPVAMLLAWLWWLIAA